MDQDQAVSLYNEAVASNPPFQLMEFGIVGLTSFALAIFFQVPMNPPLEAESNIILRAFEEGRGLDAYKMADLSAKIDRGPLIEELKLILQPTFSRSYVVIVGQIGIGKSTAIRKAMTSLEVVKGSVYFDCSDISVDIASTIGFRTQIDLGASIRRILELTTKEDKYLSPKDSGVATYTKVRKPLLEAAAKFKVKHGRPMVLVIDSIDILAERDPQLMEILQDFAKCAADMGNLRIVFISSGGICGSTALPLMMARSSWTRVVKPLFEICEVTDDTAVQYLIEQGLNSEYAYRVVRNLTGGVFSHLIDFVSASLEGITLLEMIKIRDIILREKLIISGISSSHALFLLLVDHKRIQADEALLLGLQKSQIDLLLKDSILLAHSDKTYTFYDRHTIMWFTEEVKKVK
eukprot:gene4038-5777_t